MTRRCKRRKRRTGAPKHRPKPWQTPKARRMYALKLRKSRLNPQVQEALQSAVYNEGRIAAIMGEAMCPYVLPESRRQWQAGYRDQININVPASLAGKGE